MDTIKKTSLEFVVIILVGVGIIWGFSFFIDDEDFEATVVEEEVEYVRVRIRDSYLTLEVADDAESRALGLIHREDLGEDEGMLFVYDDEDVRYFWMKDVLLPLDMIFVNEMLEIVGFLEDVPVCEEEPCPQYSIEEKSQYVIEVNAGWVDEHNLELGDRVDFIAEDLFVP